MNSLRQDGEFSIYLIETRDETGKYLDGRWYTVSFDHFASPEGFKASCECWQTTGYMGTFDEDQAIAGLHWIAKKNPGQPFRIVKKEIKQVTTEIANLKLRGRQP